MRRAIYVATVRFDGFTERPAGDLVDDELVARLRRCIETHPTLSFRVEGVKLRETDPPADDSGWKVAMDEASALLTEQGLSPTLENDLRDSIAAALRLAESRGGRSALATSSDGAARQLWESQVYQALADARGSKSGPMPEHPADAVRELLDLVRADAHAKALAQLGIPKGRA